MEETTEPGDDDTEATDTPMQGTVKVGVLQPVSGALQYYGVSSVWGFLSGLAYRADAEPIQNVETGMVSYDVGDVTYELFIRDTKLSADTAQSLGTDLVQNEGVDVLFGPTSSASATRLVNTVVKPSNVPIIIGPAASASITANSETCNDFTFRTAENTAMDARAGGKYVAAETDISKVYLFGADYSFGHAVVNNWRTVLENEGIEIVGEKFVPREYNQWEGLLDNAEAAGAEGIVTGFTVATLPNIFTTFINGDYSFRAFGGIATEITNTVLGGLLQDLLGTPLTAEKLEQEAAVGPFSTRYHWNQYDNEINSAFVDMHTEAYGKVPDLFGGGTFTAASALDQAVRAAGSTDGADIADALKGMTVQDTPKGQGGYVFQEYNNQARSAMTLANLVPTQDEWSDLWGAAIQPGAPVAEVSMDQTTIPADDSQMNCSL